MKADCIILGGGAAGLAACAALAKSGLRVVLVEKSDRVGRKIMAAGNGRCNLSNADMNPAHYGEAAPFVSAVYKSTPPDAVSAFFSSLGLMTVSEEGRIYPRTMMASSVLDVLRAGCAAENISILTGREAASLSPSRRGGWSVQLSGGEGLFAPAVLMAMGGSAAPHLGTDGAGTRMLSALGHSVTPLYPALVQLRCDHPALRSLKGVRVQAELTLTIDRKPAASETGELLFADYGVSGVCVFQLSGLAAKALGEKRRAMLSVNLLPEIPVRDAAQWLRSRIALMERADAQTLFTGVFPRILVQAILRQANLAPDAQTSQLTVRAKDALLSAITAFPLEITGTQGFKNAQVTSGGVALGEVDPASMASRLFGGLYLAGEVLDVSGPCGGYNLHFAFASGLTAAKAIKAQLLEYRKDPP